MIGVVRGGDMGKYCFVLAIFLYLCKVIDGLKCIAKHWLLVYNCKKCNDAAEKRPRYL